MKQILTTAMSLLVLALSLGGCSQNGVDNHAGKGVQIAIQFSSSVAAISDWQYRVIVSGEGMPTTTYPLSYLDGYLTGEFDIPAGPNRRFVIEVYQASPDGDLVIYRGERTITVVADEDNFQLAEIPIVLKPVVPMIRTSPVYLQTYPGGGFSVDVMLYNVPNASQISFQVHYDPLEVTPISAVLHSNFPTPNYTLFTGTGNSYYSLSVFDTVATNVAFTDSVGDAALATVFFAVSASAPLQPTQISIDSIYVVDPQGLEITPVPFLQDESTIDIISLPPVVIFGEPALEGVVKDSLHLGIKDLVTLEAAGSLTTLRARDKYLHDLNGLQSFTNLTLLNIGNNRVSDILPIKSLVGLTWLAIDHNRITTITPLTTLTSLRSLYLSDNYVIDLDALRDLKSLTTLQLWHNSIVNVGSLATLINLDTLGLGYNNITSIAALQSLTGLSWLNLEGNRIRDIAPLTRNGGLQAGDVVTLRGNPLADTSQINQLTSRGVIVIL